MDIKVPIPMLQKAKEYKEIFFKLANELYIPEDYYDLSGVDIKPARVDLEDDEHREHNVAFEGIKDVIVQGIRNAKYTIWAAVAWFTDRDIFNELMAEKKQGVPIRIITSGEPSNMTLMENPEQNFENDETLATALNKDFVKKFAHEFMKLQVGNDDGEFDW